jgi:hypothetical protein
MQKINSALIFLDFRSIRFKGADTKGSLELCRDIADYACYVAKKSGIKVVSVFSALPKKLVRSDLLGTQTLTDNLLLGIEEKLKSVEALAYLEVLGPVPEDVKQVCEKSFRSILPYSRLFGSEAGSAVAKNIASNRTLLLRKKLYREPLSRGGRQK